MRILVALESDASDMRFFSITDEDLPKEILHERKNQVGRVAKHSEKRNLRKSGPLDTVKYPESGESFYDYTALRVITYQMKIEYTVNKTPPYSGFLSVRHSCNAEINHL